MAQGSDTGRKCDCTTKKRIIILLGRDGRIMIFLRESLQYKLKITCSDTQNQAEHSGNQSSWKTMTACIRSADLSYERRKHDDIIHTCRAKKMRR